MQGVIHITSKLKIPRNVLVKLCRVIPAPFVLPNVDNMLSRVEEGGEVWEWVSLCNIPNTKDKTQNIKKNWSIYKY